MGSLIAQEVLDRVQRALNDVNNVVWSPSEVLDWINDGQRAIVTELPQAYPKREVITLAANDALQPLPNDAFRLMKVVRNMGANNTTPGRPITPVSDAQLRNIDPYWTISSPANAIKHFCYDPLTPYQFWVYPRPSIAMGVEVWVSSMPPGISDLTNPIVLDDSFFNPLIDYVLCRCYQKNSDVKGSDVMVSGYNSAFYSQLQRRNEGDKSVVTNTTATRVGIPEV